MSYSQKDLIRIRKSKLNTTTALYTSIIMGIVSFLERMIFNKIFLADYLGLYSFFNSTLTILSISELGLTTAIAYALYAPLEEDNKDQIWAIMHLYKRAYQIIGTLILTSGIILIPFIQLFINTSVPIANVRIYFLFYLLSTVCSYYLSYESILISANQEEYKVTFVTNSCWTGLYIVQIVISICTRSFLLYCIANFIANLTRGIVIKTMAEHNYSFLKEKRNIKLNKDIKRKILMNVQGLVTVKIGSVIVNATDSILTSAMVGTAFLGLYSNYQMITKGLLQVTRILPTAVTASIGNVGVTESEDKISRSFEVLSLASFFIYGPLVILMLSITNPIIDLFFSGRSISMSSVCLIYLNFYLTNFREILQTYKTSLGLYYYDRKRPIIEGIVNLVLSIFLGYFWGFNGIIGATAITNICVNLIIEPRIIYHEGLKRSSRNFYVSSILRFFLTALIAMLCYAISTLLPFSGILQIITISIICISITGIMFTLIYRKNNTAKTIIKTFIVAVFNKYRNKN